MKPEEIRAMSDSQLNARILATSVSIAENKARLRVMADAARREIARDPVTLLFARCRAWNEAGRGCHVRGDKLLGAPDGWPGGVDAEEFMTGFVREIAPGLELGDDQQGSPGEDGGGKSKSVERLHALINGGDNT